jgi:hypothetical protein
VERVFVSVAVLWGAVVKRTEIEVEFHGLMTARAIAVMMVIVSTSETSINIYKTTRRSSQKAVIWK